MLSLVLLFLATGPSISASGQSNAAALDDDSLSSSKVARQLAEVPMVQEVELAPDATSVAYTVDYSSVEANKHTLDLMLQKLDPSGKPQGEPVRVDEFPNVGDSYFISLAWCPDGSGFTYFKTMPASTSSMSPTGSETSSETLPSASSRTSLVRYDVASRNIAVVPIYDQRSLTPTTDDYGVKVERSRITRFSSNYEWSPTGKYIAFTAALAAPARLNPRAGTVRSTSLEFGEGPKTGLFVVDANTGEVQQVSPDSIHVLSFDWSPNEEAFVVAATRVSGSWPDQDSDLYILSRIGSLRPLVVQPGPDASPSWSPDGQSIAFASNFGVDDFFMPAAPAVIPAGGGEIRRFSFGDDDPPMSFRSPAVWTREGTGFYYTSTYHMVRRLAHADIKTRRLTTVPLDETYVCHRASFSADRRRVAFLRQSMADPPEVFIQSLPNGEAMRVTAVSRAFPLAELVRVDRVKWVSRDRKFTIHGMLLTPRTAWVDGGRVKAPLPTLAFNFGGPGMVFSDFGLEGYNGGTAGLAARGYAVLIPNTRGRGGFGRALHAALYEERSAASGAHDDVMAGIDMLIERGIADTNRLGVFGHSYGAFLTAYTVTATHRFKAAVIHESPIAEVMVLALPAIPGSRLERFSRTRMGGNGDPFDPVFLKRMFDESPGFHMNKVTTPTMLQYGHNEQRGGVQLFAALLHAKVPTELVAYDEGHAVARPAAKADELERLGAWFDYWLNGVPYPDATRGRDYDAWKARVAASRQSSSEVMPTVKK